MEPPMEPPDGLFVQLVYIYACRPLRFASFRLIFYNIIIVLLLVVFFLNHNL